MAKRRKKLAADVTLICGACGKLIEDSDPSMLASRRDAEGRPEEAAIHTRCKGAYFKQGR